MRGNSRLIVNRDILSRIMNLNTPPISADSSENYSGPIYGQHTICILNVRLWYYTVFVCTSDVYMLMSVHS
jgi:hypothetical protein